MGAARDKTNVIHVDFGRGARRARDGASSSSAASPPDRGSTEPEASAREPAATARRRDPTADLFTRAEVSRLFALPESRLRYWEKTGFLSPSGGTARKLYTFQDLIGLRAAKSLIERGTPLRRVRRSIDSLRTTLPHVIRPLAELRISSEGDRLVVQTDRTKWEPTSGQLVLDFDVRDLRDEVVRVLRPHQRDSARRRGAYEAYLEGSRLDGDPATIDRAEACYRRAVELDPSFGHALTNLGNLRFRRGATAEAIALYRRALEADPAQPEAHYNLGFIASERGDHASAARSFEAALESDPAFADAHFNLAMTLDALGRAAEARAHWSSYLALDPTGEWAEVARKRLARERD